MDAQFLVCLASSLGIVFLFCRRNFGESTAEKIPNDITTQLLPCHLAATHEYFKGFLVYFGAMVFAFLTLSLIGPKPLEAFGMKIPPEIGRAAILVIVAGMLVGLVANVSALKEIEKWLRKFGHEQAFIAAAAVATAERLAMADFNFASYWRLAAPQSNALSGVLQADFTAPRLHLEHSWARLNCLLYELNTRLNFGKTDGLDAVMLKKYQAEFAALWAKRNALEPAVAAARSNPKANRDEIHGRVREALFNLYILLGCAVRLKKPREPEMLAVLGSFGFVFPPIESRPQSRDMMLVGLAVMAASVLAVSLLALLLGRLDLWTVSESFPRTGFQPFNILASTVFAHCLAIFTADQVRTRRRARGAWFRQTGTALQAVPANYVGAALAAGLAGYAAFVVWGLAFQPATTDLFRDAFPYALLPATTGGFFVVHLDNAELDTRPSRFVEVGVQALVMAFGGLAAATATNVLASDGPTQGIDVILLMALIGATIGAAFGAYFPEAAATPRLDPLAAVREERVQALEAAAFSHFDDKAVAKDWIERPLGALGGVSPRVAARDIQRYEHVFDLLKAP